MKEFWFNEVVRKFDLKKNSISFDYDEVLEEEYYLDTLYVFFELIVDNLD